MTRTFLISLSLILTGTSLSAQSEESQKWLEFEAVYSSMPWYNADGGIKTGFVYIDNADVTAKVNFDKLLGFKDNLSLFIYGLGNHGDMASEYMGDFQIASNIEAPKTWRIFELWVQQNLFEDRISVLVGLYDLNSEFDVLRPGTLFINSSFGIGAEYAQSGQNGPSIFPISSLGIRMATFIGDRTRLRLAVLDAVSGDPNNLKSNVISLSLKQGALIAGELSIYTSKDFSDNQQTFERTYDTRRRKVGRQFDVYKKDKINVGGWFYTSKFEEINNSGASDTGNYGVYVGAQKYFSLNEKEDYVALFARYGIANSRFNRLGSALSGGFVVSNPISEFEDNFGVAFSSGFNGSRFQEVQMGDEKSETFIEFTYSLPLASWFLVQPDVQYVINPSTREELSDALAFALLIQLSISN